MSTKDDKVMRSFDTGATRDTAEGKLDMEGFTHPMVEKQFAKYMNMNRLQSDGKLRDSDNWQKGIPETAYIKSLKRHYDEMWANHRGFHEDGEAGIIAALCGIIFNAKGYLLEYLKYHDFKLQDFDGDEPTPEMKGRQDGIRRKNASPPVDIDTQQKLIEFLDCTSQPCVTCEGECEAKEPSPTDLPENDNKTEELPTLTYIPPGLGEPSPATFTGFCMSQFNPEDCCDCPTSHECLEMGAKELTHEQNIALQATILELIKKQTKLLVGANITSGMYDANGDIKVQVEADCFKCVNTEVRWDKWPCYECRENDSGDPDMTAKNSFFCPKNEED